MDEIKKTHGGAREGAGRKRIEKGKYYGFNSTPETDAILSAVTGSKTEFINAAILFYTEHK